ncbi:outer membrane protein assembly factor BamB family protein [Anatilimnocola floriformis]|uniref:outer membrane protein assembly factor BamB family protein n=1 Tax=Anatilimnocola floriformis TaxID=2948575 RepID=UPI0020C35241|nr:PQQ-binding-like beta-propeller repeat protein [Anatilimnocola floriformis]
MKRSGFVGLFVGWLLIASLAATFAAAQEAKTDATAKADPLDWPYWRGPEWNSISRETGLPDTINPGGGAGSNLAWKREDLGGRSTPVVLRGKLYYLTRHNPGTNKECEKIVCLDAATGETKWESIHNVWSSDVPDTRVGWSNVVGDPETGFVYALGANGLFKCLDGENGKIQWQIPLHEQYGVLTTYGGRTNSPIICEDMVIFGSVIIGWGEMAQPAHRILAFDKRNGQVRWFISTRLRPEDTIYNNPTIAVIKGQKLMITGAGDGWVYGIQPRTGKKVWEYQFSKRGLNLAPTVDGDVIYMAHSEENPPPDVTKVGAVAALDGTQEGNVSKTAEIWKTLEIADGKSSILKVKDRLYCPDDGGKLFVLDAKDGEEVCKKIGLGTINFGAPVYADGKIFYSEKNGRWYILTPDETKGATGWERTGKGKTNGTFNQGDECWASPVVSHGRLYILTTGALYCFEDKAKKKGADPQPPQPQESPVSEDQTPAQLQIVPAELLLKPGEKQTYTARLYNARGQFLKTTEAKFAVDANGTITEGGEFTAATDAKHVAAIVTASVGELKARARVRIIPPLPWKFDMEGLTDAPITWIGARYRHQLRKGPDGNSFLAKITTIPKGTRSRASLGPSDLHDYTIQADMLPHELDKKQPDMGLIAQGYTFEISGERNLLQIGSWISHDKRYFATKKFELEPGNWYTLKLQAANVDGQAVVKAKVWKRADKEPTEWSLELTDPQPNKVGAPGLFGNATNAEVFIDNVTVTPNN